MRCNSNATKRKPLKGGRERRYDDDGGESVVVEGDGNGDVR